MHTLPFRHPLATHAAGTILGYVGGKPIYPIAGGNGAGEGGSGGTPPATPPAGSPPPTPTPPPAAPPAPTPTPPAAPPGAPPEGDVKSLPDWAQKALSDARAEAGKARTVAKENAAKEAREQLLKDLGLLKPDETPDPAKLAAELGEKDARLAALADSARTQAIELAAFKAAGKHQANPAALLDSRSFLESVKGLDPSADDFGTKLDEAIKTAVEANTQLRMVPGAPRRGGGEFPGGPGTTGRPTSLGSAVAAALGGG